MAQSGESWTSPFSKQGGTLSAELEIKAESPVPVQKSSTIEG